VSGLAQRWARDIVKKCARDALEELRQEILQGAAGRDDCLVPALSNRIRLLLEKGTGPTLRTVINATGVVVHTNLGRSPLSHRVADRIVRAAVNYSNLEYDLEAGRRGERNAHLRGMIRELTGAEAALAVNNNAAAVLLALAALAAGKEVVVSRGELIEIGGSFRIPDVMSQSGAILREVGTTNRTHPKDYIEGINEKTALILKVHPSNYRIQGFTREVALPELTAIGREKGVPTMMDLGSGSLVDLSKYGLSGETTVQQVVAAGVDVVTFSGDKLLGGPQAGVIVGKAAYVEKMRGHPLARALRMDKLTLSGLEATLEEYTRPDGPLAGIPTLGMITRSAEELGKCAETLADGIRFGLAGRADVTITEGVGRVGGGAVPMGDLPGPRVAVRPRYSSVASVERRLRAGDPPLIVLVKDDCILIDPRTLLPDQANLIPDLLAAGFE
jgi:L-seryl-tRNA(Ser) seleniumtransferase